jgi:hypothetical protein
MQCLVFWSHWTSITRPFDFRTQICIKIEWFGYFMSSTYLYPTRPLYHVLKSRKDWEWLKQDGRHSLLKLKSGYNLY